jgi:hypothetical protein
LDRSADVVSVGSLSIVISYDERVAFPKSFMPVPKAHTMQSEGGDTGTEVILRRTLPLYLQRSTVEARDMETCSGSCSTRDCARETWRVPVWIPASIEIRGGEGVAEGGIVNGRTRVIDRKLDYACHLIHGRSRPGPRCRQEISINGQPPDLLARLQAGDSITPFALCDPSHRSISLRETITTILNP